MTKEQKKQIADQLRALADRVETQDLKWVWIKAQYNDGASIMYATDGAPKRPGGFK